MPGDDNEVDGPVGVPAADGPVWLGVLKSTPAEIDFDALPVELRPTPEAPQDAVTESE
ncbi:hypothetical protein [Actinokineospora diospyrosa]|uniref:Uncharacterized protein n=1 Tax=Actinokineospora diospyrosa TaxID=103728 RepID=A0ABT1IP07_9PSEU|nr:hypothetical protein [Actinokineospora diospyrosa]MCP2274400.1 hypothetical protein [Actinokineospora diospyrosa]